MDRNTLRTTLGFSATLIRKLTGISLRANRPEAVYNYRSINDWLSSSGQPTEKQLRAIYDEGFQLIVNLAPSDGENSLPDEAKTVSELGMKYIHIPVDFKAPTDSDFEDFVEVMRANSDEKVWVHCAANMRVSAFLYRYRRDVLKVEENIAREDLNAIWKPMGAWPKFLGWT